MKMTQEEQSAYDKLVESSDNPKRYSAADLIQTDRIGNLELALRYTGTDQIADPDVAAAWLRAQEVIQELRITIHRVAEAKAELDAHRA